jgi:hypothetical protein
MNKLLEQLLGLRDKCAKYQDEISNKSERGNCIKAGCFGMIHNYAVATLELLNFYKMMWENPKILGLEVPRMDEDLERARKENKES